MKIALYFTGQFRTFSLCIDTVKKYLLDQYEKIDIFISCAKELDIDKKLVLFGEHQQQIKNIELWDDPIFDYTKYQNRPCSDVKIRNLMFQLYNLKMSNQLKQKYEKDNGFKYDISIKIRPDVFIQKGPIECLSLIRKNHIYFPNHDHWNGIHDRMYFGANHLMDIIDNRFDYIDDFYNAGGILHAETYLRSVIERNQIHCLPSDLQVLLQRQTDQRTAPIRDIGEFPKLEYGNSDWSFHRKWINHDGKRKTIL